MILKLLLFFTTLSFNIYFSLHAKETLEKKYLINKNSIENTMCHWKDIIKRAAQQYSIDEKLIKSIIYVESSGNPHVKSRSNAIGLMQIKASSAGLEVYRLHGKKTQPSIKELYDPQINISIGTSYLNLLQQRNLFGIKNKDIMRYATIVSYVNGSNILLQIFSKNKQEAISIINTMTIKSFYEYIKKNIRQYKHHVI